MSVDVKTMLAQVDSMTCEECLAAAPQVREAIRLHPYSLGQLLDSGEWEDLEDLQVLHAALGDRIDILRFEEYNRQLGDRK
jgi:hypothetical protein